MEDNKTPRNSRRKCSFCGRSENEVGFLITGMNGCICDSCSEQAYEIMQEAMHQKKGEPGELNLKELGNDNLETLAQKGQQAWNEMLGRIEVEGGSLDQYRMFYSCLYRSLLFPRKFYEIDAAGKVMHYSPTTGEVLPGYYYTDTGVWDTFRCLFPLLNLMYPSVNKEIQEGYLNAYRESGFYPEWASPGHRGCMVGNNTASVLADAFLKSIPV